MLKNKGDAFWRAVNAEYNDPLMLQEFGSYQSYQGFLWAQSVKGDAAATKDFFNAITARFVAKAMGRTPTITFDDLIMTNFGGTSSDGGEAKQENNNSVDKVTEIAPGLEIREYLPNVQNFKGILAAGIKIFLGYKGDLSGYSNVDWVQSITADAMEDRGRDFGFPINDAYQYNVPFYYSKDQQDRTDIDNAAIILNYDKMFGDGPARRFKQNDYSWSAELSLVGQRNGQYENIITIQYGFNFRSGIIYLSPIKVINPSGFQQSLFNLNK